MFSNSGWSYAKFYLLPYSALSTIDAGSKGSFHLSLPLLSQATSPHHYAEVSQPRCAYINTLFFHYSYSLHHTTTSYNFKLPSRLPVSSTPITLFSNTKPSSQTSSTMGGCGNASCSCSSCGCAAGSCTCGVSLTLFTFVHSHHRHLLFPKLPVLPSSLSCATTSSRSRTSTLPTNMLTSFTEISSSLYLTSSLRCPTSTSFTSRPR